MKDSVNKYLRIVSGQEVKLSPTGIEVRCCGRKVRIEVLKSGKIALYAQKEIQIAVTEDIHLMAKGMVNIRGGKTVSMECAQGGSLHLDDKGNITITGIEAHMN